MLAVLMPLTCGKLTHTEVTQSASTTIAGANPIQAILSRLGFSGFGSIDFSQSQTIQNQGISKSQINGTKLKTLTLDITSPAGQDFSFIDSIKFYAETTGQPKVLVASGSGFGARSSVGLDVADVELVAYVTAASMDITSEVTGRSPQSTTVVAARAVFDVDVNLGGVLCGGN